MKKLLLLCFLAAGSASLSAEPAAPQAATPPPAAHGHDHEETELDDKMSTMNGAFKKLRRQIADPAANVSSLELVAKLLKASEASAALIPAKAATLPEAERAKFTADYAAKMTAFIDEVKKLETALKADDNTTAATILKQLGDLQKQGHRTFRLPEKE